MSKYKQLTYELRCQIYALKKTEMTQQEMADTVGVSQATISRELKRNTGGNGYRFSQAQRKTQERRDKAVTATKMTPTMYYLS